MIPEEFEKQFVHPRPGRTLITGSRVVSASRTDRRLLYKDAVGVDAEAGTGVDKVLDLEKDFLVERVGTFVHVECVSLLEHTQRPWLVAENIQSAMELNATIYLTVPFVWRVHGYPSDYWRLTTSAVEFIFPDIHWETLIYAWPTGSSSKKIPMVESIGANGFPFFARTEVLGFGVKK